MDTEKLIDELDAIASTDVFVGSPTFGRVRLNREVARTILRAAFAEVRRAYLREVLTAVSTWVGEGESQYGIERRLKALLPPAAEGVGPEAPYGECSCGAEMDEHGCPFGH